MATTGIQTKKLKSGKKSYALWYKDPATGKQHHYKCYRYLKIAQQEEQKLRILLDTGSASDGPLKRRRTAVKFRMIADILVQQWNDKLVNGELEKVTVDNYMIHLRKLSVVFGDRFMGDISQDEVLQYQTDTVREISKITANRRLFVLKQVFATAEKEKAIVKDVVAPTGYLSEKENERTSSLAPRQLMGLLNLARTARTKHYMVLAILLAAEHGAAKQEILSLQWEDIDFDFDELGYIHFFRTKNEVKRMHPLKMSRTREALLERRRYLAKCRGIEEEQVDGYVICRPDGTAFGDIKKGWETIRKAAGIPDFNFHDLRHTCCTNLLRSGSSLKAVKEYIGHKTLRMTDRYAHLESYFELAGFEGLDAIYTKELVQRKG